MSTLSGARARRRVCILSSVHSALDTRIFHKQARTLAAAGYQVTLVAQSEGDLCLDGVQIRALPPTAARWRRPILWLRLLIEALRSRPDIVHIHDPELLPLALLLQAVLRRPAVYDVHEYYGDEVRTRLWIPAPLRNAAGWLTDRIERSVARRLAAVVTVNEHMNARFIVIQPRSVAVHNYPPAEYFSGVSSGPRSQIVTYVGVLTRDRGIETIFRTGLLLKRRFPALEIAIAGTLDWSGVDGEIPRDPETWRQEAGVRFLGLVPQREVPELLGRASAGWIPFLRTPNNVRSTPNKLLEYMAAALPVVASDFGYMRSIVSDASCGLLAKPADPADHAEQLGRLLANPDEALQMGDRGRCAVLARYTWASQGERLLSLYEELTGVASER